MSLSRFEPFREIELFSRQVNDIFKHFDKNITRREKDGFVPTIDISEDEKSIFISAELAGISKEDLSIKIDDQNVLSISGEKTQKFGTNADSTSTVLRSELIYGSFERSVALPEIDRQSIKARFKDGILHIEIAKLLPVPPKETTVEIQ